MNTLGIRIKRLRKEKRLSQQALALACGWASQSRIGNYEKGTRQPNLADLEKIATALDVTLPDLVAGKDRSELEYLPDPIQGRVRSEDYLVTNWGRSGDRGQPITSIVGWTKEGTVPVVGSAKLGSLGSFETTDMVSEDIGDGALRIHSDDPNAYGLRIVGDSMHPRIKNGEFVLIEPNMPYTSGDEVMIRTTDGRAMIKEYIYLRDGMYRLDSVNAAAPLHLAEADVKQIHLVGGILKSSRFLHSAAEK